MSRRLAFSICLVAWLACGEAAVAGGPETEQSLAGKGARRLAAADFTSLYVGNTLSGTTSDGEAFHVFVESGTAYRMQYQGKKSTDRWTVGKDGEFCTADGAETTCTREWMHEQAIYSFNPDGSLAGTARIRPGNPEKL
jgi:hypothetical protein